MRVPADFFTRPASTTSVSLGRGSSATVARDIATYNVLPPQSSHPGDGTVPEAFITDLNP